MKKRSTDAQKIMGVLPQMFTSEGLERIDRELYWGLSVVDDTPKPLSELQQADTGIGYVIGQARKASSMNVEPLPNDKLEETTSASETDFPSKDVNLDETLLSQDLDRPSGKPQKQWWHK